MAQIEHSKGGEMSAKKVSISAIEPYQESFEFINPGERSFRGETTFVDFNIEQSFASLFSSLAVAGAFVHMGDAPMIEASFASILGIKSFVSSWQK